MGEISTQTTLDDALGRIQSLLQTARIGPPRWVQHDLTFGQLRLLFILAQAPLSIGRLADMLSVTDATASEIVDRLEKRGLATRSHRADARRVVECSISGEGTRLLADVNGARREALRAALSVLTPAERTQFDALVATMVGRLSAARTPPASAEGDAQVISGFSIAVPPAEAGETA